MNRVFVLLTVSSLIACRDSAPSSSTTAPTQASVSATPVTSTGTPAPAPEVADASRPQRNFEEAARLDLRTGIVLQNAFTVENNGNVFFTSNTLGNATEWYGHVTQADVQRVEDVIRKNKFCELANSERTQHLMSQMTLSLHGLSCSVTLSYPTWKKNPRARATFHAVRELMKASCAEQCARDWGMPDD